MGLGSIRLLLAFMVVTSHTPGYPHGVWPDIGWVAVVTFFFISGYLMPLAFERNYVGREWRERALRFWANRILRIYPLYWIALAGMFVILWVKQGQALEIASNNSIIYFLKNVLLCGMNQSWLGEPDVRLVGPAWSLDIELQYYLLVPALCFIGLKVDRWGCFVLGAAIVMTAVTFISPLGMQAIDRALPGWAMFFLLGFMFQRSGSIWSAKAFSSNVKVWTTQSGLIIAGLLLMMYLAATGQPKMSSVAFAGVSLGGAALSLSQAARNSCSIFDNALGDLSYPVFLFHPLLIEVDAGQRLLSHIPQLKGMVESVLVLAASYCLLAALVGLIAHNLVVLPINKARDAIKSASSVRKVIGSC
jgi:peptidoglycan/LPS O-acetylase OafA/YrhL